MINIISWNMRGAEKEVKRRRLKKLIKMNDVSFVAIQEPKLLVSKLPAFAKCIGMKHFCPNILAERNIWILWLDRINIKIIFEHEQALTGELKFMNSELFWLTVVYAKCKQILRRDLWQHLNNLTIPCNMPWIVLGDFNSILSSDERRGGAFPSLSSMEDFGDFLDQRGLVDCGFNGINIPGVIIDRDILECYKGWIGL